MDRIGRRQDQCTPRANRSWAFGDESYNGLGLYLVAAVLASPAEVEIRRPMIREGLAQPVRGRFHFTKEDHRGRVRALETISTLPVTSVVVVCRDLVRPERARRQCLGALLWHAHDRIDRLDLESRSPHGDRRDSMTIRAQRPQCCDRIEYRFTAAMDDPWLWVADAVAGAAFQALARHRSEYVDLLPPLPIEFVEA